MVIPDEKGGIKKLRIPSIVIHSAAVLVAMLSIIVAIMVFDYWKIFKEVYRNKHITQENKLLKEQISLFKIKIDTLSKDLNRLHIFEKKLRVITGLENTPQSRESLNQDQTFIDFEDYQNTLEYQKTRQYYRKKISNKMQVNNTKDNSSVKRLSEQSLNLADDFSTLDYQYGEVKKTLTSIEENLHELDTFVMDKQSILESTPTLLPANGWITSYFGPRLSPYGKNKKRVKMHEGLDIGAPRGTAVIAPADGVITFSGKRTGFGNMVKINHGYGVETLFAHAHKLHVRSGQKIRRGDKIAQVGNTGYSTGPHLHYEVHVNGIAVDPFYFILQ